MDQSTFDMVLSDTLAASGVGLNEAVVRLQALSELYMAVISSKTSPGNQRVRLPSWTNDIQPTINQAKPTESLKVALKLPPNFEDEDPDRGSFPANCNRDFIETIEAIADEDGPKIVDLYPDKADRLRILKRISELSEGQNGKPIVIYGLGGRAAVRLGPEQSRWAKEHYPSTTPEAKTVIGMVVAGKLHGNRMFEVDDGYKRVYVEAKAADGVNINPLKILTESMGKVVSLEGTAFYAKNGYLKNISNVTTVQLYDYEVRSVSFNDRMYHLKHSIKFDVSADVDERDFLFSNKDLDMYCSSKSVEGAARAVNEEFDVVWREIVESDEEQLHDSAVKLRRLLEGLVEKAERAGA